MRRDSCREVDEAVRRVPQQNPLGVNGPELMEWFFHHARVEADARPDGEIGIDDDIAAQGFDGIGAKCCGASPRFGIGSTSRILPRREKNATGV